QYGVGRRKAESRKPEANKRPVPVRRCMETAQNSETEILSSNLQGVPVSREPGQRRQRHLCFPPTAFCPLPTAQCLLPSAPVLASRPRRGGLKNQDGRARDGAGVGTGGR